MQERNRNFGRVSRPVDKTAAPRQAAPKQRKSGRIKQAELGRSKQQRSRATPLAVAKLPPMVAAIDEIMPAAAAPEAAAVAPSAADLHAALPEIGATVEAAPSIDRSAAVLLAETEAAPSIVEPERTDPPAPALTLSMDPLARPAAPNPVRSAKRRPVLRWAAAGSVALACLFVFGRFSDAHLPAPSAPAVSADDAPVARPVADGASQKPAFALLPMDVAVLPPVTEIAADGADALVEAATLPPATAERVTARAVAAPEKADAQGARAAAPKKPPAKQVAARSGAPRSQAEPSRQGSRGPILDFLSDLLP